MASPPRSVYALACLYVEAQHLTSNDRILPLNLPSPATAASGEFRLNEHANVAPGERIEHRSGFATRLPEKWISEFAHLLGWLIGDGSVRRGSKAGAGNTDNATWIYNGEDRDAFLEQHQQVLAEILGFVPKPSERPNGTVQLRASRRAVVDFLEALGVTTGRAVDKRVPRSVLEAPVEIQAAFLRGLYDADGCAGETSNDTRYVGLGSVSIELLRDVQRLLSTFGIGSRIYPTRKRGDTHFTYTTVGGESRSYSGGDLYDLRVSGENLRKFATAIGFDHPAKAARLSGWLENHRLYRADQTAALASRTFEGFETTYNLSEPRNHSYIANGVVVRNCSEYMSLDNSSCNLASLNLMKFLRDDDTFDADLFRRAVELIITAMDISICFADFPTEAIGDTTRAYRQLGIGYANLGALLMATGHAYDSDGGRGLAAAITSLMTGTAYRRSAELAGVVGPLQLVLHLVAVDVGDTHVIRAYRLVHHGAMIPRPGDRAVRRSTDLGVRFGRPGGRPAGPDPRSPRPDAESQDRHGDAQRHAGRPRDQGRQGRVPRRQDRHHSRAARQDLVPGPEPHRERARAGGQCREGETVGGQGQVPPQRHDVLDDGSGHHHRYHPRHRDGEALIMAVTKADKIEELEQLERAFQGDADPLSRVHAFASSVQASDGWSHLTSLLDYESNLATVDLRLRKRAERNDGDAIASCILDRLSH